MSRLEGWQPQSRLPRWKELRKAAPRREALRKTGRRGNCDGPWERPRRQVLDLPASLKGTPWETGAPGNTYWYHASQSLSLIHISEPTRLGMISYAVFC